MTATATLDDLRNKESTINGLGGIVNGGYLRDRWNQRATVEVTDAGNSIYVNDSLHNVWVRGGAKLGTFNGDEEGPNYIIPQ